jgi:hypothetical protein
MRLLLAAAIVLSQAGCSIGVGSAYVGQWRAHDEVEFKACLEDEAGRCISEKESVKHVPERSYTGFILAYPALGTAWVTEGDRTSLRFRVEPSAELLHGKGPAAIGVRVSTVIDTRAAVSLPLMLLGHYSLGERLSVHAGAGVSPWARRGTDVAVLGGRGLLGFQWALGRVRTENYWVLSVEGDTQWIAFDRSYRSTGLTAHLGIFF